VGFIVWWAALAAITLGWWWGTTAPVSGVVSVVMETGRLLGFMSGLGVITLVVLAARIPPLDNALGSQTLYRWHGWLGRYSVTMILCHFVFITAGYALTDQTGVLATLWSFLLDHNLLLAMLAALSLLVTGLLSGTALRRKLSYEAWQGLHIVTYVAILFGVLHQTSLGAQFLMHPVASTLWNLAYLVPVATLLVNRLVRPLAMNLAHQFTVTAVRQEGEHVYSVYIGGVGLENLNASAGQYIRVHAAVPGLRWASNPYSLSAPPRKGQWRITVEVLGEQSARLVSLPVGTRLWLEGPLGGLTLDDGNRPVVLVAGGTGVTPIRALAEAALVQRPKAPVVVIQRVRTPADQLFAAEWAQMTRWAKGRLAVHLKAGSRNVPGNQLDAAALHRLAPWIARADVYVCGSVELADYVKSAAMTAGAASVRIESFGW